MFARKDVFRLSKLGHSALPSPTPRVHLLTQIRINHNTSTITLSIVCVLQILYYVLHSDTCICVSTSVASPNTSAARGSLYSLPSFLLTTQNNGYFSTQVIVRADVPADANRTRTPIKPGPRIYACSLTALSTTERTIAQCVATSQTQRSTTEAKCKNYDSNARNIARTTLSTYETHTDYRLPHGSSIYRD